MFTLRDDFEVSKSEKLKEVQQGGINERESLEISCSEEPIGFPRVIDFAQTKCDPTTRLRMVWK